MIGQELRLRIISAILLAIPFMLITWLGGIWFRLLASLVALLIFYEFAGITKLADREPAERLVGWTTLGAVVVLAVLGWSFWALGALAVGIALALLPALRVHRAPWGAIALGYAGLFAIALSELRGETVFGLYAVVFIIAIVWATDIMAYFCGRAIGGRKLAPAISPGKTWSGALFGAGAGIAAGLAVALTFRPGGSPVVPLLALALSVASQAGDLFESWVKRRFSVKDSGRIIPGHGGVMDRVDGLVFAVFAAFLFTLVLPPAASGDGSGELAARLLSH